MRNDVLSWDQYFMGMAHLSAKRSKDPNTRVGACIVNPQKRVVGLGYNGFPAELNAILNSIQDLHGCTLYVSLFPCNECAKAIIQAGITCVVYESDKYAGTEGNIASKRMFHDAGVELIQLPYDIEVETKINNR